MPKSFTVELDDIPAQIVELVAEHQGVSPDILLSSVARTWVTHQIDVAEAIRAAIERRKDPTPEPPKREKDYELALATELTSRGISVRRQVKTKRGIADLVAGERAVVEVKLDIRTWRDVHQAQGQADAYATALGLVHAIVCAPGVPEEFRSATVCDAAEAADLIAALCHAGTVAEPEPNRD